jgi:hypothetical protein
MKFMILTIMLFFANVSLANDVIIEWIGSNSNGQLLHVTVNSKKYTFEVKNEDLNDKNVEKIVENVVKTINSTERQRVFTRGSLHKD